MLKQRLVAELSATLLHFTSDYHGIPASPGFACLPHAVKCFHSVSRPWGLGHHDVRWICRPIAPIHQSRQFSPHRPPPTHKSTSLVSTNMHSTITQASRQAVPLLDLLSVAQCCGLWPRHDHPSNCSDCRCWIETKVQSTTARPPWPSSLIKEERCWPVQRCLGETAQQVPSTVAGGARQLRRLKSPL